MPHLPASWRPVAATLLIVLAGAAAPPAARAQAEARPAPRTWPPALGAAWDAYLGGDPVTAQRLAGPLAAAGPDERTRQAAALLQALCLLRMPARADRVDGRARLAQLASADPGLLEDPECNLAYGIGQTALHETADALDRLERAAEGFVARGQPERALAALVALAEAWAAHTEWEVTPERFGVRRPLGAEQADAVRRRQIEALRARVAALPGHAAALAQVDLVLGRLLLGASATAADGRAILGRLAAAGPLDAPQAEAAILLAEDLAQGGQPEAALALYERVRRAGPAAAAAEAAERQAALVRPVLALDVPAAAGSDESLRIGLRARGLDAVQLEVRQADVAGWLASAAARGRDVLLPESGSVRAARDFDTRSPAPHAWWDAAEAGAPLEVVLPPGAYVVVARGVDREARAHVVKRLVCVSDLIATCVVGPRQAVIWAAPRHRPAGAAPAAAGWDAAALEGAFWMQRSFVATPVRFDGVTGGFALPAEARVMRDRRWFCLVRAGDHLALCCGELPAPAVDEGRAAPVALLGGPPEVAAGESYHAAGLVLSRGQAAVAGAGLELQVSDATEAVKFTVAVEPTPGGAFAARVPVPEALAGGHLRIVPRAGAHVVENVLPRPGARVADAAAATFRVRLEVPAWLEGPGEALTGTVRAEYPWGGAPTGARATCLLDPVRLPPPGVNEPPQAGDRVAAESEVAGAGRFRFEAPASALPPLDAPLAVHTVAAVRALDGRRGEAHADLLLGPAPAHAWLTCTPAEPRAGDDVRFGLGWYAPPGRALRGLPEIEVRRGPDRVAGLRVYPGPDGAESEPWRPLEAGTYEVVADLAAVDGAPLHARLSVVVDAPETGAVIAARPRCTAHFTRGADGPAVRVQLAGHSATPLLVVVESEDPLAARALPRLAGAAELVLPLGACPPSAARVLVLGVAGGGSEVLGVEEVAPDPEDAAALHIEAARAEAWPGTELPVRVRCPLPAEALGGAALVVRLVSALEVGWGVTFPTDRRGPWTVPGSGLTLASSTGRPPGPPEGPAQAAGGAWMPGPLRTALLEGTTLWATAGAPAGAETELRVPLPDEPGLYKLIAALRTADGIVATGTCFVDAQRGLRVRLDLPARLTLGDRTLAALRIESGYLEPIEARVAWPPGDGLKIDALRVVAADGPATALRVGEPAVLRLLPGEHVWVQADCEAVRAGAGAIAAEVSVRGAQRSVVRPCEVLPGAPVTPPEGAVRIIRAVAAATGAPGAEPPAVDGVPRSPRAGLRALPWEELGPDTRLVPGAYLRIQEQVVVAEPLRALIWTQRAPATCHPVRALPSDGQTIGVPRPAPPDALGYAVTELGPGTHVHEYYLAVVRPGACELPVPELAAEGRAVPAVVYPGGLRPVVREAR